MPITVQQVIDAFDQVAVGEETIAQVGGRNVVVVRQHDREGNVLGVVFVCVHAKAGDGNQDGYVLLSNDGATISVYKAGGWEEDFGG